MFTFGSMEVELRMAEVRDGAVLKLTQTKIPETPDGRVMGHLNCRSCWVFFLTNLQSVLERSVDLRNHDPQRASSMEVGYQLIENIP